MRTWSIYNLETGMFTGHRVTCDFKHLDANIPAGCGIVEGEYDHLSEKLNLETKKIIQYIPARPSENHEWNESIKRWVYVPTPLEVCQAARKPLYPRIEELADAIYHNENGNNKPMEDYIQKCNGVKLRIPKPV